MTNTIYRPLIAKAWQTTWHHKKLWIVAVLAGVANSGSVIDIVFRTFKRAADLPSAHTLLEGATPGAASLARYVQTLTLVSSQRIQVTVCLAMLAVVLLALLTAIGQANLIHVLPLAERNKRYKLFMPDWTTIGRILGVNIVMRFTMIVVSLIVGGLMFALKTGTAGGDALVIFAILLAFVPTALLISYLSIFSVIEVVARRRSVFGSIKASFHVLTRHWLPMTELAVVLFFVNLIITVATIGSILVFAVPYLLSLRGATLSGSGILWISVIAVGTFLAFLLVLMFFGLMTTFTYALWYYAYEKFGKRTSIASKIERVMHYVQQRSPLH